jgi:predicted RNA-binding protein with RPS1 domain
MSKDDIPTVISENAKIKNDIKVLIVKIDDLENSLSWEIKTEVLNAKESIEYKIQNQSLEFNEQFTQLNERLTHVVDQLTVAFSNKIVNHEKRISKLEKTASTA